MCIDRSKRTLMDIGDRYLGSYFMDDRALIAVSLEAARTLREQAQKPTRDLYFVYTTNEEIGGIGGSYASRTLPGDLTLALEVGPAEDEYDTECSGGPIVAQSDAQCVYDKPVADRLMDLAAKKGYAPQAAVLGAFESDASHAKASGITPRAGLLCLSTLRTHGYEVVARDASPTLVDVLVEFLLNPA